MENPYRRSINKYSHYVSYVEKVKRLKREKKHDEVIELLLNLIDAVEKESRLKSWPVAPWYYEQLAIVYRKEKRLADEVKILERYFSQNTGRAGKVGNLKKRLKEVIKLRDKAQR